MFRLRPAQADRDRAEGSVESDAVLYHRPAVRAGNSVQRGFVVDGSQEAAVQSDLDAPGRTSGDDEGHESDVGLPASIPRNSGQP